MSKKVLIIDDDIDVVEAMKIALESVGYEIEYAYGTDEGFEKLLSFGPDLLILDVMMGKGAGGFVLARKIRKDSRFDDVPVLMLTSMTEQTGFNFPGKGVDEKFLPVDDFIEKGIAPHELLEKVDQQLAKKSAS